MYNELKKVCDSLRDNNIENTNPIHKYINDLPRYPFYKMNVDADGKLVDIKKVVDDEVKNGCMWIISYGNFDMNYNSKPLNIIFKEDLSLEESEVLKVCLECKNLSSKKKYDNGKCLACSNSKLVLDIADNKIKNDKYNNKVVQKAKSVIVKNYFHYKDVMVGKYGKLVNNVIDNQDIIFDALPLILVQSCRNGKVLFKDFLAMAFGESDKGQESKIGFVIDGYPIKNSIFESKVRNEVSEVLFKLDRDNIGDDWVVCSLTGKKGHRCSGNTKLKFPTLGDYYITSVNENTPCLDRYGTFDGFEISQETSDAMLMDMKYVFDRKFENRLWASFPLKKTMVLGYINGKLSVAIDDEMKDFIITEMAGSNIQEDTVTSLEVYKDRIMNQIAAISKCKKMQEDDVVNILIFKGGTGQVEIIYNAALEIKNIKESLEKWLDALDNIPDNSMLSNNKYSYVTMPIIFKILRYKYISDKNDFRVQEVKYGDMQLIEMVYEMFWRNNPFYIRKVMDQVLDNSRNLLISESYKNNFKIFQDISRIHRLMGAMLYKLNISKEDYMDGVAYNLGRLMSWMNYMQEQYHVEQSKKNGGERKKGVSIIGSHFIGYEGMRMAFSNPHRAYNHMCKRNLFYAEWARQHGHFGLVSILTDINRKLEGQIIPSKCDVDFETQLHMGFLYRPDKKELEVPDDTVQASELSPV